MSVSKQRKRTARKASVPGVPPRLQRSVESGDLESLVAQYLNADLFRMAAIRMLISDYRSTEQRAESLENFNLPAYAEHQADCNATKRTIRKMLRDLFGVDIYGHTLRQTKESEEGEEGQDRSAASPDSEEAE